MENHSRTLSHTVTHTAHVCGVPQVAEQIRQARRTGRARWRGYEPGPVASILGCVTTWEFAVAERRSEGAESHRTTARLFVILIHVIVLFLFAFLFTRVCCRSIFTVYRIGPGGEWAPGEPPYCTTHGSAQPLLTLLRRRYASHRIASRFPDYCTLVPRTHTRALPVCAAEFAHRTVTGTLRWALRGLGRGCRGWNPSTRTTRSANPDFLSHIYISGWTRGAPQCHDALVRSLIGT